MIDSTLVTQIEQLVASAENILVLTHARPDGDALGSLTAVGQWLAQIGKTYTLAVDEGIFNRFHYLPQSDQVRHAPHEDQTYDLLIAVDCGDANRMGDAYKSLVDVPPIINIDHHITNPNYGVANYVQADATSTCEMLYTLFEALQLDITKEMGISLLTGIVTDTQSFRIPTTTAKTLEISSKIMALGVDLHAITLQSLLLESETTAYLWRELLQNMQLEDGIASASVTLDDKLRVGYEGTGSAGLNNYLSNINTAKMAVVFTEFEPDVIRVSFRSRPPMNVANIAAQFGGGGHAQAAGCTIHAPLQEAIDQVISRSKEALG